MTLDELSTILATTGVGTGAAALAYENPYIQNKMIRAVAGKKKTTVPLVAALSYGLLDGSGEGRMAANQSDILRRAGIDSVFINPNTGNNYDRYLISTHGKDIATSQAASDFHTFTKSNQLHKPIPRINDLSFNEIKTIRSKILNHGTNDGFKPLGRNLIGGIPEGFWYEITSNASKTDGGTTLLAKKFLKDELHGFKPLELATNIRLLGKDCLTNRIKMAPAENMEKILKTTGMVINGERGMEYTGLGLDTLHGISDEGAKTGIHNVKDTTRAWAGNSILEFNSKDGSGPYRVRNLMRDAGFSPNYTEDLKKPISGSRIDRSIWNRVGLLADFRHNKDRKFILNYLNADDMINNPNGFFTRTGKINNLANKKIVFYTAGGTGAQAGSKLRAMLAALVDQKTGKIRDDVHIVFQQGNAETASRPGGRLLSTDEEVALLKKYQKDIPELQDRITFVKNMSPETLSKFRTGSDLILYAPGSSTATEIAGSRVPNIAMRDTKLNEGNADFAKVYGSGSYKAPRQVHDVNHWSYKHEDGLRTIFNSDDPRAFYNFDKNLKDANLEREVSDFADFRKLVDEALSDDPKIKAKVKADRGKYVKNLIRNMRQSEDDVINAAGLALRKNNMIKGKFIPSKYKAPVLAGAAGLSALAGLAVASRKRKKWYEF